MATAAAADRAAALEQMSAARGTLGLRTQQLNIPERQHRMEQDVGPQGTQGGETDAQTAQGAEPGTQISSKRAGAILLLARRVRSKLIEVRGLSEEEFAETFQDHEADIMGMVELLVRRFHSSAAELLSS